MIKLIPYFDTNYGNELAKKMFSLRKKYLSADITQNDDKVMFDGTQAKGYIADITLYHQQKISILDEQTIKEIYSFFV